MTSMLKLEDGERVILVTELTGDTAVIIGRRAVTKPPEVRYFMAFTNFGRTFKYNSMINCWSAASEI